MGNPQRTTCTVKLPGKPPEPIAPSCSGCQCFDAPAERPENVDAVAWVNAGKDKGSCIRFPQPVRKAPAERCFEFLPKEIQPDAR